MNIKKYISELLYKHDSVVLPDFGAFICIVKNSEWEHGTQTLFPPKKIISFNDKIKNNDGLLAHYISNEKNISIQDAQQQLDDFVRELKNHIARNEIFTFPNVGTLQYTSDSRYVFKPEEINYNEDSFGLLPTKGTVTFKVEHEQEIRHVEKFIPIANSHPKKTNKAWYYAAAVIIICCTVFAGQSIYNLYYKNKNNWNEAGIKETVVSSNSVANNIKEQKSNINPEAQQKALENEAIEAVSSNIVEQLETSTLENKTLTATETTIEQTTNEVFSKKNMIVFGSFYQYKHAKELCEKLLSEKNISSSVIRTADGKYYKSVIIIEGSRSKAFAEMNAIKQEKKIDAFVSTDVVKVF